MGFFGDAWDATGGKVVGVAKDIGNYITTGTTDPGKRRQEYLDPYKVNSAAFKPQNYAGASTAIKNAASTRGDARITREQAEGRLLQGVQAPTPIRVAPAGASMGAADSGLNTFYGWMNGQANDSRTAQASNLAQLGALAAGRGPSVAQDMVRANANTAAADTERAISRANNAYGQASDDATRVYLDSAAKAAADYMNASADQQLAFEQAAMNAGTATRQAAEDSIRMQAALTSSARGGNIGAALLNAQDNAAFQMAGANRQASEQQAQAGLAASYQAAAAQRQAAQQGAAAQLQAAYGQTVADRQTAAGAQEAAIAAQQTRAAGDIEAGRIRSSEMLAGQDALTGALNTARGDDIAVMGQLGSAANTGLGASQLATSANQFDARLAFDQQAQNAQNVLAAEGMTQDALQSVLSSSAGREAMAFAAQDNWGQLAVQLGVQEQTLKSQAYAAAQAMGMNWDTMTQQSRSNLIGGLFSAGGAIGAAALISDRRAKTIKGKAPVPDFRKARSERYEYKPKYKAHPHAGPGERTGPMAQQLPSNVVRKGTDGTLEVDINQLALSLASAVGDLQRRAG